MCCQAVGNLSKGTGQRGDRETDLMLKMIRKAEMPKTTLLISVCQIRASPLCVDGTHKGATASIFRMCKI